VFKITEGKGFQITFANGYTVSVQWGPGNYCDNYTANFHQSEICGAKGSSTAETWAWKPDGTPLWSDVRAYRSPDEVAQDILEVASQ
jgi:hypothetical protein